MENDVLKNKIAPWQEKGRWYHAKLSCDGSTWSIDTNNSDKFIVDNCVINSTNYLLSSKWHILNIVRYFYKAFTTSTNLTADIRYSTLGEIAVLPYASAYSGEADIWIYAIIK